MFASVTSDVKPFNMLQRVREDAVLPPAGGVRDYPENEAPEETLYGAEDPGWKLAPFFPGRSRRTTMSLAAIAHQRNVECAIVRGANECIALGHAVHTHVICCIILTLDDFAPDKYGKHKGFDSLPTICKALSPSPLLARRLLLGSAPGQIPTVHTEVEAKDFAAKKCKDMHNRTQKTARAERDDVGGVVLS